MITKCDDGEAVIFAAPSEDVINLMRVYHDVKVNPTVLDIRTLSTITFPQKVRLCIKPEKTYLIAEWSVNAVSISIYSNGNIDFLRYQPIETPSNDWQYKADVSNNSGMSYDGDIEEYHIPLTDQIFESGPYFEFLSFLSS